ncbi:GNAT family N-acetyltransferase [Humibacter sp. RRB41]|uniref:GNAT family N-acetyltransferase n=1 Tax=Humibacter sp. RRB41 TaxID=2919946 RepID=UPI001FAA098D|nr:GNAT family N-acetyltransferase [Humibacter sp. RRB41]
MTAISVTLARWSEDDLPLLEQANTPAMTQFLGGPETDEQVVARHAKYLGYWDEDLGWWYRVDADQVGAGGIGYWPVEHEGVAAYELGWHVLPAFQGRGIATRALQAIIPIVAARGDRALLIASPSVDNLASNAVCRAAGFVRAGSHTVPWRGGTLTFNTWVHELGDRT